MNPWENWTPCNLRGTATTLREMEMATIAEKLEAFADLLQAELDGKRCVLPGEVAEKEINCLCACGTWLAWEHGAITKQGKGSTQQAAIEDLAAKLRGEG